MHKVPFPSAQRPRILVQVGLKFAACGGHYRWILLLTSEPFDSWAAAMFLFVQVGFNSLYCFFFFCSFLLTTA